MFYAPFVAQEWSLNSFQEHKMDNDRVAKSELLEVEVEVQFQTSLILVSDGDH
jgi:hypothetical protein